MATTTTNLGLTKPIGTEKALVSVINGNMDIIDNKVGAIPQNESVQSQITALNNHVTAIEQNDSIASSLTGTNCTVSICLAQYINKLAIYYIEFVASSAISAETEIISGLKVPSGTRNNTSVFIGCGVVSPFQTYNLVVRDGGKIMTLSAIPNGTRIRATFMYFTN